MRPRYNRITWKVKHLHIDLDQATQDVAASSRQSKMTKDEFIDSLVAFLMEDGYEPRMPLERMKRLLKSPHSESEGYVFLKIENDERIKLVLHIRWSQHPLNEWSKNYTGRQMKEHYTDTTLVSDLESEFGVDGTEAKTKFMDVLEQGSDLFTIICVDGTFFNSYNDALEHIKEEVLEFDRGA